MHLYSVDIYLELLLQEWYLQLGKRVSKWSEHEITGLSF